MKSKEFIERLQALDPEGELELGISDGAISDISILTNSLNYTIEDGKFKVKDGEVLHISTLDIKDYLWCNSENIDDVVGAIEIDLESEQITKSIVNDVNRTVNEIKQTLEQSNHRILYLILHQIKKGYDILDKSGELFYINSGTEKTEKLSKPEVSFIKDSQFFKKVDNRYYPDFS